MEEVAMARRRGILISLVCILALMILLSPDQLFAQRRDREIRRGRREITVVKPPADRTRLVVGGREYLYARGVFYRSGPAGFLAVRGPLGARIRVLPPGYVTLHFGGVPYFLYYGTYYQFDPAQKVYVVVTAPQGAAPPSMFDRVDLVTGETIEGTYLGGTQSTVQMEVNGNVQEIPVDQIISITFAPPSE
jgi:hypothetical protein